MPFIRARAEVKVLPRRLGHVTADDAERVPCGALNSSEVGVGRAGVVDWLATRIAPDADQVRQQDQSSLVPVSPQVRLGITPRNCDAIARMQLIQRYPAVELSELVVSCRPYYPAGAGFQFEHCLEPSAPDPCREPRTQPPVVERHHLSCLPS